MKNIFIPIAVFMMLMMASLFSVRHSYNVAKNEIESDLNKALALTLKNKERFIITQDTIRAYKQLRNSVSNGNVMIAVSDEKFCNYLKNKKLKDSSFITFDIVDGDYSSSELDESVISSDTVIINNAYEGNTIALRGYTRLSSAAILGMSDLRMSYVFAVSAVLWAVFSLVYIKKKNNVLSASDDFGGMYYSETDNCFYNASHSPIHFTPMQHQLMLMFWNSPNHSLTKEDICSELWPKKDDANDTLYTLIKRLKPVIETHTNLSVVSDRGRCYSLEIRKIES